MCSGMSIHLKKCFLESVLLIAICRNEFGCAGMNLGVSVPG